MANIKDRDDWFDIWFNDKQSILATMVSNMADDLKVGYDYFGACITRQRQEIENYRKAIDDQLDKFKTMDENSVERWCFYELKKTGAIS